MKAHPEDVLETVLTFGLQPAVNRHALPVETVQDILYDFVNDNSEPCPCRQSKFVTMCFHCAGRQMSSTLRERLNKINHEL